jgi:hypothetical protein
MTEHELDRQIQNLHDLGYPALAGIGADDLDDLLRPLRDRLPPGGAAEDGRIPFLLVVKDSLVATVDAVARWRVGGKAGWTDMEAELSGFAPIGGVEVPAGPAYLLLDVDTGRDTLGVTPRRRPAEDPRRGTHPADHRRGRRPGDPAPRRLHCPQRLPGTRFPGAEQAGPELLGQQGCAPARLVLGR